MNNSNIDFEYLYNQILEKIEQEIDKKIEEKITEILYAPILEEKTWPRKKRT